MCAIHGFFWPNKNGQIEKMISLAHHRGPDGNGSYSDEYITLGHNLLSIVDTVELSNQPIITDQYVLVYNGEIYNYQDLKHGLDYNFQTNTDTEVLFAGLILQGVSFLSKIDGMFAFAFYNKQTKELIIGRDSNGAKPFYYGELQGKFAFSSEIKSLLSLGFNRKVDTEGFKHYFYAGLVAGPLTCFSAIKKLIPGEVMSINVSTGKKVTINLNDKRIKAFNGNPEDLPVLVQQKLKQGVELTLMGRRKIGLFLSGGMDSSSIFYEMYHSLKTIPNTFSTRFKIPINHHTYNEDADLANELSKLYKANHHEVLVTQEDWINSLEKTILALEEPRQGKSYSAYYLTNKLLSDNKITVTLSGDGGDELLAGYKHHRYPNWHRKFTSLRLGHRELKNPIFKLTVDQQMEYLNSWLPKKQLTGDVLNDFLYTECLHTLSEDFLIRNDKLGMAFSMEARFPMMSNVFKDFIRSIPSVHKTIPEFYNTNPLQYNKPLLKNAYRDKLPDNIIDRNKTGWRAPTDDWIIGKEAHPADDKTELREYFRSILYDPEIMEIFEITTDDIENRYLNNRDWDGALKYTGPNIGLVSQKELFIVIMFAIWYKKFNMSM